MIEPVGREPQMARDGREQPVSSAIERGEQFEEGRFEAFRPGGPDIGGHVTREAVIGGKLTADMPEFLQVDMLGVLGDLDLERSVAALAAAARGEIAALLFLGGANSSAVSFQARSIRSCEMP